MYLTPSVLFGRPQSEIASTIKDRMTQSTSVSIVTGFATKRGLDAIVGPIRSQPNKLKNLILGASTYGGFEAMDSLLATGVPRGRLYVHLGHTAATGGKKNPFARYHPMLHSKVYYMELPEERACAFIGSHNTTNYAMTGQNGEAAVLLEGLASSPEFEKVRQHIELARLQSVIYTSDMKEAYAWWTREFIEGLKSEIGVSTDWTAVRTILLFASVAGPDRPKKGEHIYFEIPAGIEQIESLKTETHLFLFDTLPASPSIALDLASAAPARYNCITLGADNKQGNKEVVAQWRVEGPRPVLTRVPNGTYRPNPPAGMQQVRAEIKESSIQAL
jgi:HKD family nuclease